jgi:DNA-binding NtrC family response regulator
MEKRIVVVDEEPMMVKAIKRLLRHEPFDFHGFRSPSRALQYMDRAAPQVVLSEMRMPEMEGVRFLEKVRKKWPDTIRMIMAGSYIPERVLQARQRGDVSAILLKPLDDKHLIRTIHDAFYYYDAMYRLKVHPRGICVEKASFR